MKKKLFFIYIFTLILCSILILKNKISQYFDLQKELQMENLRKERLGFDMKKINSHYMKLKRTIKAIKEKFDELEIEYVVNNDEQRYVFKIKAEDFWRNYIVIRSKLISLEVELMQMRVVSEPREWVFLEFE